MGKKKVIKQTEEELLKEGEKAEKSAVKKDVKTALSPGRIGEGRIYISSSYNNTIITLTDNQGNVLAWSSAGAVGFKVGACCFRGRPGVSQIVEFGCAGGRDASEICVSFNGES